MMKYNPTLGTNLQTFSHGTKCVPILWFTIHWWIDAICLHHIIRHVFALSLHKSHPPTEHFNVHREHTAAILCQLWNTPRGWKVKLNFNRGSCNLFVKAERENRKVINQTRLSRSKVLLDLSSSVFHLDAGEKEIISTFQVLELA